MDMSVSYVARKMQGKLSNPHTSVPPYLRTISLKIQGRQGEVEFGGKMAKIGLDKKPILWSIERVVKDISKIEGISLTMEGMTFSGVRQMVASVNTLAWVLRIKVNGKNQLKAEYSAEPNITKPSK